MVTDGIVSLILAVSVRRLSSAIEEIVLLVDLVDVGGGLVTVDDEDVRETNEMGSNTERFISRDLSAEEVMDVAPRLALLPDK